MSGADNRCLCMTIPMVATLTCCKVLPLSLVNLLEAVMAFLLVQEFGALEAFSYSELQLVVVYMSIIDALR
jgi:hypothetical protein